MSRRLVSAIVGLTLALGSPEMARAQVVRLSPTVAAGQLATLCDIAGPWRRITPLVRWSSLVPLGVRWANLLPGSGSSGYVNVYLTDGGHSAHRVIESQPDHSRRTTVQWSATGRGRRDWRSMPPSRSRSASAPWPRVRPTPTSSAASSP
jgi:hypothetical protein